MLQNTYQILCRICVLFYYHIFVRNGSLLARHAITRGSFFPMAEICRCFREGKGRNGRTSLLERREAAKDGSPLGPTTEDSPGSKNIRLQGSRLRSLSATRIKEDGND